MEKCPYRSVCKCPGYDEEVGEWEPISGFARVPEGFLCLDWDVVIPLENAPQLNLPEGRHIADAAVAADKIDEAKRKWGKSKKRKEAQERYRRSERGQAAWARYLDSEKRRLVYQKYINSKKGKEALRSRNNKLKGFRKAQRWLKLNPGKTYEDYRKALGTEKSELGITVGEPKEGENGQL